jgi:hypothetical protein
MWLEGTWPESTHQSLICDYFIYFKDTLSCLHLLKGSEMTGFSHFQRINPSAEMVMIDRMFNQEERASLSRDKRLALVDPGKKHQHANEGEPLS